MDKEKFQERVERIKEVDGFIKTLDPSIREAAFKLLETYITGRARRLTGETGQEQSTGFEGDTRSDKVTKEEFFSQFDHDKPADNALLIAAYHYSQHGNAILTAQEARQIADSAGITVPARIDVTYGEVRRKQKNLFQRSGKGKFKPTVHGEIFFKETYKVTKGTETKADSVVDK